MIHLTEFNSWSANCPNCGKSGLVEDQYDEITCDCGMVIPQGGWKCRVCGEGIEGEDYLLSPYCSKDCENFDNS